MLTTTPIEILENVTLYYVEHKNGVTAEQICELIPGAELADVDMLLRSSYVLGLDWDINLHGEISYTPCKFVLAKLAKHAVLARMDEPASGLSSEQIRDILRK